MSDVQPAVPRLLYIDDDHGLSRLVQKEMARHGFEVVQAHDADDGLRHAAEQRFDCIALDHFLPDAEGLEILPQLLAMPDAPPVVYVTGAQESRIAVAALKSGAADYVVKDVAEDFASLLRSAVEDAIARDRMRREKEAAEAEVRAARDRAEVLHQEVNHRVGTSLQMVSSFIALQSRTLSDAAARDALKVTQARIEAVAQVHRRLYTSHDVEAVQLDDYFAGLTEELRQSLSSSDRAPPQILLDVEPVSVPTDRAVSLGVVLTELLTNAVKYAYPDGGGEIRIRLARQDGKGLLVVEDEGVGLPETGPARGTGLGRTIIGAMAQNLRSTVQYDKAHKGVRASLTFDV
jgi:two-component sensor histidine kinase